MLEVLGLVYLIICYHQVLFQFVYKVFASQLSLLGWCVILTLLIQVFHFVNHLVRIHTHRSELVELEDFIILPNPVRVIKHGAFALKPD